LAISSAVATSRHRPRGARRPHATASVVAGGCEWVISDAPLHRVHLLDAARRSPTASPSPPHQTKVSRLPFGPAGRRRRSRARRGRARAQRGDAERRLAPVARIADDAPADPLAAELELRLDHRQQLAAGREAAGDGRQDLGQRDEGDVDRRQAGGEGQVGGRELAGVEPLDHGHARILAHAQVDLAVGDVDRGDPGGAALQQAVGEAAGGGADVEAVAARDVDAERLERVLELDPPAGDEARRLSSLRSASGSTSWLGRSATGPSSPTGPRRHGPRQRRPSETGKSPLCQNGVDSCLGASRHAGTVQPSSPELKKTLARCLATP
jgi:hypothetical protein